MYDKTFNLCYLRLHYSPKLKLTSDTFSLPREGEEHSQFYRYSNQSFRFITENYILVSYNNHFCFFA